MLACNLSFEYFLFACYCASTPLYIIVCYVLGRVPSSDKILGNSFFRIVISTGIVDIVYATTIYFGLNFRQWGWAYSFYAQIDPIPRYLTCIGFSACFSQCIGTMLIAFNRYTALAMPLRHEVWIIITYFSLWQKSEILYMQHWKPLLLLSVWVEHNNLK